MKVLVCGSRDFDDGYLVNYMLSGLRYEDEGLHIIHGGAKGADEWAEIWCQSWSNPEDVTVTTFPAAWKKLGKAAGPLRNQRMVEEKPDIVLAFVNKPLQESIGTLDMVTRAREMGIKVVVVESDSR